MTHLPRPVRACPVRACPVRACLLQAALAIALLLGPTGCGGYVLNGQAVKGSFGSIRFVDADAAALAHAGVAEAQISLYRDPDSLGRRLIARGISDDTGAVSIDVGEFGTGWMVEEWLIRVSRPGYETVESVVTLPKASSGRRLLITLSPGGSITPGDDDVMESYERFR